MESDDPVSKGQEVYICNSTAQNHLQFRGDICTVTLKVINSAWLHNHRVLISCSSVLRRWLSSFALRNRIKWLCLEFSNLASQLKSVMVRVKSEVFFLHTDLGVYLILICSQQVIVWRRTTALYLMRCVVVMLEYNIWLVIEGHPFYFESLCMLVASDEVFTQLRL